jgi:hypothetical protein
MIILAAALSGPAAAGEPALPFDIPRKLPNGEFLFFKGALSSSAFPYSDGTAIHVYNYADTEKAQADFGSLENSSRLVKEDEDADLAGIGARAFKTGDTKFIAFRMDDAIIAVAYDEKTLDTPQALKVGAGIYNRALEKMKQRFASPVDTLKTFCEAIEQSNEPLLFECLAGPVDESFRRNVKRSLSSGYTNASSQGPLFSIAEKVEIDNQTVNCRVIDEGPNLWSAPWFRVIRDSFPSLNLSRWSNAVENIWVPFRKQGELWKIDIVLLKKKGFAKTEEEFKDWQSLQDCRRNFSQLAAFLRTWKRNMRGNLPEDPRDLITSSGGSWLVCPGGKNKGLKLDEFGSNLLYFPYKEDIVELPSNAVVFADRLGSHSSPEPQRLVLTADARVMTLPEDQAARMISEAMERMKVYQPGEIEETTEPEVPEEPLTEGEKELIRKLIGQLGADSWEIREKAQEGLVEFGPRAKPLLVEALDTDDDEVKWRIGRIIKEYGKGK